MVQAAPAEFTGSRGPRTRSLRLPSTAQLTEHAPGQSNCQGFYLAVSEVSKSFHLSFEFCPSHSLNSFPFP